ncbi:MAG: 5-methylthioadenosine/S-adenosylhomocysteine deaminase [Solirubrobacteraceae bacterium]|jgi:5-methylthioadenosine/S-adenosylhomocysteine deaminase|nr:5-methylthioadenosine/S-adenosylhomocysteine deaminase [Solirubrobacteraceae bacterium]
MACVRAAEGDTLIFGDPIVVLGRMGCMPDAAMVLRQGMVVWVGPRSEAPPADAFDRVLGSAEHAVLPGFINGHYHSEATLDRILFETGIDRYSTAWHVQSAMPIDEQALYDAVLTGLIACVRGGQTSIVDMFYGNPGLPDFGVDAALQAYRDLGVRVGFGLCSRDQNIYVHAPDESFLCRLSRQIADEVRESAIGYAWPAADVLRAYRRLVERWDEPEGRIRVIPAPDWTPACSDELYGTCTDLASEFAVPLTSHVLESRYEMAASHKLYGKSAVRRLADLGVLDAGLTCAHVVWATREDLEILANSHAVVAHNPSSNLRTAQGIAPVRELMDLGGRFVVGTDALSFSDSEDYLLDLRLAAYLQRRPRNLTDGRVDSLRLLSMMAAAGAQATGQEGRLGSLEPGRRADLLLLRTGRVFAPRSRSSNWDPLDVILDKADARDIETVLVDGRILVHDGHIQTVDADRVLDRHHEEIDRRERRLRDDPAIRREFVELPAMLDEHVTAMYHQELLNHVVCGEPYNLVGPER